MFLEFQRITTAQASKKQPIIVDSSSIMSIEEDQFEDKEGTLGGGMFTATRVEVIGFPKYTFFTMTPMNTVLGYLNHVDLTGGTVLPGSSCDGNDTVIDVLYPQIEYPMVKVNMIFNRTISETDVYVFNSNLIVYAESTIFVDSMTMLQETGLTISLRDTQPRSFLTKLDYAQLKALLNPVEIL